MPKRKTKSKELEREARKISKQARNLRRSAARLRKTAELTVLASRIDVLTRGLRNAMDSKKSSELIAKEGREFIIKEIGQRKGTLKADFVKALFDLSKAGDLNWFVSRASEKKGVVSVKALDEAIQVFNEIYVDSVAWSKAVGLATKRFFGNKRVMNARGIENMFSYPVMEILNRSKLILMALTRKKH